MFFQGNYITLFAFTFLSCSVSGINRFLFTIQSSKLCIATCIVQGLPSGTAQAFFHYIQ